MLLEEPHESGGSGRAVFHAARIRGPPLLPYDRCHMSTETAHPARDLAPSSALPLAYYVLAHMAFGGALLALAVNPSLPGGSFYQSRFAALVHLVTIGWISGSILGSFYIVAPLALGMSMKVGLTDWITFVSFAAGTGLMVGALWTGRYDSVAWAGLLVSVAIAWVAVRAARGMPRSSAPGGVTLHVALAFLNILAAAALGVLVALDRSRGFLGLSPLAVTFAHIHLAAGGWAAMMVVGLAYRLIPMMLPSAMPTGGGLAISAILMETGLVVLVLTLLGDATWTALGWMLMGGGLVSFAVQMRRSVGRRMPRPPALPSRDWSTWQAHAALVWLLLAAAAGGALAFGVGAEWRLRLMWIYGFASILGFLGQIIAGIQGRLVPFYAWYRAFAALGRPPARGANALPSALLARRIFFAWTAGLPLLGIGLTFELPVLIRLGASTLGLGVLLGAGYLLHMLRAAKSPAA